jgi:hypothetical protein
VEGGVQSHARPRPDDHTGLRRLFQVLARNHKKRADIQDENNTPGVLHEDRTRSHMAPSRALDFLEAARESRLERNDLGVDRSELGL